MCATVKGCFLWLMVIHPIMGIQTWWIPFGKLTFCYGKSPFYSWVNPLFPWAILQFANCKRLPGNPWGPWMKRELILQIWCLGFHPRVHPPWLFHRAVVMVDALKKCIKNTMNYYSLLMNKEVQLVQPQCITFLGGKYPAHVRFELFLRPGRPGHRFSWMRSMASRHSWFARCAYFGCRSKAFFSSWPVRTMWPKKVMFVGL
jgi:hypothetical protein